MRLPSLNGGAVKSWFKTGSCFSELTPAQLAGATLWDSFLKMRGIYVGFAMEINAGDQPFWTLA